MKVDLNVQYKLNNTLYDEEREMGEDNWSYEIGSMNWSSGVWNQ